MFPASRSLGVSQWPQAHGSQYWSLCCSGTQAPAHKSHIDYECDRFDYLFHRVARCPWSADTRFIMTKCIIYNYSTSIKWGIYAAGRLLPPPAQSRTSRTVCRWNPGFSWWRTSQLDFQRFQSARQSAIYIYSAWESKIKWISMLKFQCWMKSFTVSPAKITN